MKKKGFLLMKSTLKIIIAAICILFLLILIYKIYESYSVKQELIQAEKSMKKIETGLKEAESKGSAEVIILYPDAGRWGRTWFLTTWPSKAKLFTGPGIMPKKCKLKFWNNCLCLCTGRSTTTQGVADDCDDNGICIEIKKIADVGAIDKITFSDTPFTLQIKHQGNRFEITKK